MITQERYINPFTDFGFKKLFGTKANKELVIDFLNELIKEQGKITDIQYLPTEQLGCTEEEKKAVFDIYCQTERGETFIVEMQQVKQKFFKERSIYYSTFPIRDQIKPGNKSFELKPVYFVGILNFVFDEHKNASNYFHHEVKLMEIHRNEVFYDNLTYIYLEMPKFNKTEDELETHFDKWLYVLKNLPKLAERPVRLQERVFEALFHAAEIAKLPQIERTKYEASWRNYIDIVSYFDTATEDGWEKGLKEGLKEGLKKGEKKGEKKGLKEGREKGREETTIAFVRNLRQNNVLEQDIMKFTGLSEEELKNLPI